MLLIFTEKPNNYFSKEFLKKILRCVLNKSRGPQAVNDSLKRGLDELGVEYLWNKKNLNKDSIIFVNDSLDALKWAIRLKQKNKIKKLISGPNMVAFPDDYNKIILSKEIDLILFPSQWTKDFFCSKYQELNQKIKLWPAGVAYSPESNIEKKGVIIFGKNNQTLQDDIVKYIDGKIDYIVIEYGQFKQKDYYSLLNKNKHLIYISNSESQGLALQEAWMRNVSTMVWNRGYWQSGAEKWFNEKISAPYLNNQSGLFFKDINDFENKFDQFLNSDFSAREYCLNNLSDKKSAEIFLEIIKEYDK